MRTQQPAEECQRLLKVTAYCVSGVHTSTGVDDSLGAHFGPLAKVSMQETDVVWEFVLSVVRGASCLHH